MNLKNRTELTINALLGQAVGDAFGVPVEFQSRAEIQALDLQEMAGACRNQLPDTRWGNQIPAGSWSDDTSMTVASMASFVRNGGKIDYSDQPAQFVRWWNVDFFFQLLQDDSEEDEKDECSFHVAVFFLPPLMKGAHLFILLPSGCTFKRYTQPPCSRSRFESLC